MDVRHGLVRVVCVEQHAVRQDLDPFRHPREFADDATPDWSPDGKRIAFMSLRNGNADLFTIHPDGTHVKQVTTSPGDDVLPSWAPGGAKLAFVHVSGANQQVFTIKADGTGLTKITHSP